MRPLLQHAQRSLLANASLVVPKHQTRHFTSIRSAVLNAPSVCLQCQYRASIAFRPNRNPQWPSQAPKRRNLHQPSREEKPKEQDDVQEKRGTASEEKPLEKPLPDVIELSSSTTAPAPGKESSTLPYAQLSSSDTFSSSRTEGGRKEEVKDNIQRVPAEQLPSHREAQRWDFSKQFQKYMDDLLPKLAVVTQKVNTLTGTDYSGIEALKREIKEQETLVKSRRSAIGEAKQALETALSQQASSQKEVVALLERKHSWSATDLERYMSLIRSEHVNDQAVREAKENITRAENALEEARSQLERRERAQYHEEQIWSDTIRRNSTWVTFGLMGLNIFLLLVTMVIIEPWRRRRMVREIKNALEAQKTAIEPALAAQAVAASSAAATPVIATEVRKEAESMETAPSSPVAAPPVEPASSTQQEPELAAPKTTEATEPPTVVPDASSVSVQDSPVDLPQAPVPSGEPVSLASINIDEEVRTSTPWAHWQEKATYIAKDIISERTISMRRIDFTTAVLQGAAAGAVITAAVVAMLVRR